LPAGQAMIVSSSRPTRIPDIDVSATRQRHSRLKSSTTARILNRRLSARASLTKSRDQRWFGPCGIVIGALEAPFPRISFATYYYTREAPPNWNATVHSTVFKARPEERLRRYLLMPAELLQFANGVHWVKRGVRRLVNAVH
jgi:hypothetical protein